MLTPLGAWPKKTHALQVKLQWRVALLPGVRVCNGTGAPLALCLSSPASLVVAPARNAELPLAASLEGSAEAALVESETLLELAPGVGTRAQELSNAGPAGHSVFSAGPVEEVSPAAVLNRLGMISHELAMVSTATTVSAA